VSKSNSIALAIVRWPVGWGSLVTLGFYFAVHKYGIDNELVYRYFASHPVEYLSMGMFFVGMFALIFKGFNIAAQRAQMSAITLSPAQPDGDSVENIAMLQEQLQITAGSGTESYLAKRLHDALEFVRRKGSGAGLDEYLRFASDMDSVKMHSSYALVRIVIWAIPILGFLGTVMGITMAIANLAGVEDIEKSMPLVVSGLKVAFDTTALALGLSIGLMFTQFAVDRLESNLLSKVDDRANDELVGRFPEGEDTSDPNTAAFKRMAEGVIQACDRLVERQTTLWRSSMDAAQQQWQQSTAAGGRLLTESLGAALQNGMAAHAAALTKAEQTAAQQARLHWNEMHQTVQKSTEVLARQQVELAKQGTLLLKTLEATDHVRELEGALNRNLDTLSNEHNFEETVLSLSAAIQLLTAQLHGGVVSRRKNTKVETNAA
jgi:biopolymer transport protein ExbB/TolQ